MPSKKTHLVIAVVGIAILGAAAWLWQRKGDASIPRAVGGAASAAVQGPSAAGKGNPGHGPGGAGAPAPVEVGLVQALRVSDDVQTVGSLRSRRGVMLRPEAAGRIVQINFADGQRVKGGQLLVQLDDTLQRAQLQQAEAQATIARTNLQRSRELLAQGFVSQSAVDQNDAALQVAQAQVALARAQLARMKVLAPFDATAGIRLVNLGDYLKDGADIVNLEDLSSMRVDFRLPERYVAQVKVGQAVEIAIDALPGRAFTGSVVALDALVDADGRSLLIRAQIDNAGTVLRPGMFARPRIVFAVRTGALMVPEEALLPQGSRQYVYRIEADGKGGEQARRIEARLGLRQPGKVELLAGVQPGDRVVIAGHDRLRGELVPVRVVELKPAAGGRPKAGTNGGGAGSAAGAGASAASGVRGPLPA
ncbi:MAG: efflux transporter periplasmic adaptor subunit [Rubrivivax sp. SCN 71-131]|nr:MAG: efflux transporter periplasmic adaptor subunit [Rubrivivax sp. SCN 71-131]